MLKRAPTSIISTAAWPDEEIDYEEDAKKFIELQEAKLEKIIKEVKIMPDRYSIREYPK